MANEPDHHALNHQLTGGQKVGKLGVLGLEVGLRILNQVALERRFTVDERSDNVTGARFADFEDDDVAVADEGTDHGLATHFEREAFRGAGDAEGLDIDGDALLRVLDHVGGSHSGGNLAENRDVHDFRTIEILREDDRTRFVRMALDDTLLFQRP